MLQDNNIIDDESCVINVNVNGLMISLRPNTPSPSAEQLFHQLFHFVELPNAPSSSRLKQQRWTARRIQRRWNWKKGHGRQCYEKLSSDLKNIWIEMTNNYKANYGKLSTE